MWQEPCLNWQEQNRFQKTSEDVISLPDFEILSVLWIKYYIEFLLGRWTLAGFGITTRDAVMLWGQVNRSRHNTHRKKILDFTSYPNRFSWPTGRQHRDTVLSDIPQPSSAREDDDWGSPCPEDGDFFMQCQTLLEQRRPSVSLSVAWSARSNLVLTDCILC